MDSVNLLELVPIQVIQVVEGSPPGPPDPWVAALPEALGIPTLLRPPDGLHVDERDFQFRLKCQLRSAGFIRAGDVRVVDMLVLPNGKKAVLVEWTFDFFRMTGQGGSGEEWKEGRALLAVDETEALLIASAWREAMEPAIERARAKQAESTGTLAMEQTLRKHALDGIAVERRRCQAIVHAMQDPATILAERRIALLDAEHAPADIDRFLTTHPR